MKCIRHTRSGYGRKIPRGANKGRTPPDVMKVNDRNAVAELRRVLNANFRPMDYHLVLTHEGDPPPSQEEAKAALERFIRKCRAEYKREGLEFKYVAVTEYLHTRIHHHIVVPRAELSRITALWGGIVRVSVLDNSGQYGALAALPDKGNHQDHEGAGKPSQTPVDGEPQPDPPTTQGGGGKGEGLAGGTEGDKRVYSRQGQRKKRRFCRHGNAHAVL